MTQTLRLRSPALWLLSFLAIAQIGYAEDTESHFSEEEVKASADYLATLGICSNSTLLELAKIESSGCKDRISNYSASCWGELDRLKLDYELAKDESSKDMLIAISLSYESCLRASLLYKIVHEKEKSVHAAMPMADEFETMQYAIKAASCGELAFKFDPPLSRELVDSSFEAYVRYFGSLQKRLSRGGRQAGDQGLLFREPRENAAVALGRQFGATEARLIQVVRDQGGGDVIAAARENFENDGCSNL